MGNDQREEAREPEQVGRLFLRRLNAGDAEGLAQLYEPDAVLATPNGQTAVGRDAIGRLYEQMLTDRPTFQEGQHAPVLRAGDLALTSTHLVDGGTTVEVLRRQDNGTWLMALDQPNVLSDSGPKPMTQ